MNEKTVKYNERVTNVKAYAVEIIEGAPVTKEIELQLEGNRSIEMAQRIVDRQFKDKEVRPVVHAIDVEVITYELALDTFKRQATVTSA